MNLNFFQEEDLTKDLSLHEEINNKKQTILFSSEKKVEQNQGKEKIKYKRFKINRKVEEKEEKPKSKIFKAEEKIEIKVNPPLEKNIIFFLKMYHIHINDFGNSFSL